MDRDLDQVVAAGQRLVDRVVDDLVDEVVQAARAGRADVHAGTLADRLETLQDGDVLGVITRFRLLVVAVVVGSHDAFRLHMRRPGVGTGRPAAGAGPYVVIILAGGPL